jgi:hypothetical protein
MAKSTAACWNPLAPESAARWLPVNGFEGRIEQLTLSLDAQTGEYTRLIRFLPGVDTSASGGNCHRYPEETFIVSGRLFDYATGQWLEQGHYTSRPPGEVHGPVRTDTGCVVLEISFPDRIAE